MTSFVGGVNGRSQFALRAQTALCVVLLIFIVHSSQAQTCQTQIHTRTDSQTVPCSLAFSVRRRICLNGDTIQTVRNLNLPSGAWVCAPQSSLGSCTGSCNSTSVTVQILCVWGISRINCPFTYTIKNCDNLLWREWTTVSTCPANNYTYEGQVRSCYNCDNVTTNSQYCPGNSTRQLPCAGTWTNYTLTRNCSYVSPSCTATTELTRQCLYEDGTVLNDTRACSNDSAVKLETCSLPYDCPASWTNWTTTRDCSYVSPSCSATTSHNRQCLYLNGTQVSNSSLCSNGPTDKNESCSLPYGCPANWTEWQTVQNCTYVSPSCTATARFSRTCLYVNGTSATVCSGDGQKTENCTLPTPCPASWTPWETTRTCSYVTPNSCQATNASRRLCIQQDGSEAANTTSCSDDISAKVENCTTVESCPVNWTEWETTRNCSYVYPSCTPSVDQMRQCLYWNGTQADNGACSSDPANTTDGCYLQHACCNCLNATLCPECPTVYVGTTMTPATTTSTSTAATTTTSTDVGIIVTPATTTSTESTTTTTTARTNPVPGNQPINAGTTTTTILPPASIDGTNATASNRPTRIPKSGNTSEAETVTFQQTTITGEVSANPSTAVEASADISGSSAPGAEVPSDAPPASISETVFSQTAQQPAANTRSNAAVEGEATTSPSDRASPVTSEHTYPPCEQVAPQTGLDLTSNLSVNVGAVYHQPSAQSGGNHDQSGVQVSSAVEKEFIGAIVVSCISIVAAVCSLAYAIKLKSQLKLSRKINPYRYRESSIKLPLFE